MKKLLILAVIGSSLFCSFSLAVQASNDGKIKANDTSAKPFRGKYDTWMRIGYKAYNKKDYNTALINFKRALKLRPNDVYATKAIHNTEKRLAGN